jgi:Big-like domain-containing protein
VTQALDPNEATALFRSGTELAFLTDPYTGFVMGRWMNQPVLAVAVPPNLPLYFTENPVIIYGTYVPPAPGVAVRAIITIRTAGWTVRGNNMAVELPNGQVVDLTVAYEDANGDHASPPGPITWSSSDEEIATVEANADPADGTVALVTAVAEGAATITALSGGITATLDVDITASGGDAVSGTITAGEPHDPVAPEQQPAQVQGRGGRSAPPPTFGPAPVPRPAVGQPLRPGTTGQPPRPPQRPR